MNIQLLNNLKKCLNHSLIVGTKLISDDYKLKKAIEDFGELEKLNGFSNENHVFAKIKKLCDEIFSFQNVNDKILETLSLVDAILYTQGKNEVEDFSDYEELKTQKGEFFNIPYSFKNPSKDEFLDYLEKNPSIKNTHFFWKRFHFIPKEKQINILLDNLKKNPSFINSINFWENRTVLSENIKKEFFKGEISIPYGIKEIYEREFFKNKNLTKIKFPSSVTTIENQAFYECENLTEIEFSNSITKIGFTAFCKCTKLKQINLPKSLTFIFRNAFNNCSSLEKIEFPQSLEFIGYTAFANCTKLTQIELPKSLKTLESEAFCGCTNLSEIKLPNTIKKFEDCVFSSCKIENYENKYLKIKDGLAFSKDEKTFLYCADSRKTKIEIPSFIEKIGEKAFCDFENLIEIKIPNTVKILEERAFDGCKKLEKIKIPSSITEINRYTFNLCENLKEIELPDSITKIDSGSFRYCIHLTEITIPESVIAFGSCVFEMSSLKKIIFKGTKDQWEKIEFGDWNDELKKAEIIFEK